MKNSLWALLASLILIFLSHDLRAQFYVTSSPGTKKTQKAISEKGITIHISEETIQAYEKKGIPLSIYLKVGEERVIQNIVPVKRDPTAVSKSTVQSGEIQPLKGHQIQVYSGLSFTELTGTSKIGNTEANIVSESGYHVGIQWKKQLWPSWTLNSSLEGTQYQLQTGNGLLSQKPSESLAGLNLGMTHHGFSWVQLDLLADYREELFLSLNGAALSLQKKWLPSFLIRAHIPILSFNDHTLSSQLQAKYILSSSNIDSGTSLGGNLTYSYQWSTPSQVGLQAGYFNRSQDSQQFSQSQKEINFLLFYNYEFGGPQ